GELSGGEQQRVAVARALILKPEIILADEPTGNLDSRTGEAIFDLLLSLNQQLNITLLVVTHNESIASKMSRRIVLIDGQVAAQ
ncbi:MAG: ATP-binding cassette domain-containing protein, partial [Deltaproteobacteria bacterium]|nr:ATP-binding cassette domain-containing protein [Deltaproteobacteria bacterium]